MKDNLLCFLLLILVNLFYYVPNTTAYPIINGIVDNTLRYKFHVSIHRKIPPQNRYVYTCGGTIISEKYILTAAHCFVMVGSNNVIQEISYPCGTTKIIAGSYNRDGPGIERDIIRAFIPAGSNRQLLYVDLAVAELSENLGVRQYPDRLAIMPLGELDPHSNAGVNQGAMFCGFGYDMLVQKRDGRTVPTKSSNTIQRFMNSKILARNECPVFDKAICVRNADTHVFRTACFGDSGSGLIHDNKIVGVLSHGPKACDTLDPIKFTRLYGYTRFIMEAQNPHGDHSSMQVLYENPGGSARCRAQ